MGRSATGVCCGFRQHSGQESKYDCGSRTGENQELENFRHHQWKRKLLSDPVSLERVLTCSDSSSPENFEKSSPADVDISEQEYYDCIFLPHW